MTESYYPAHASLSRDEILNALEHDDLKRFVEARRASNFSGGRKSDFEKKAPEIFWCPNHGCWHRR
jgi:hypothetical protein